MNVAHASVYTDFQGLAKLKTAARKDSDSALEETAQQFEAMMMQMMLKSMRQASSGEGLADSDQSLFYRDMYDQQLAIHLAKSGGLGLTEVIKRQLGEANDAATLPGKEVENYRQQAIMKAPASITSIDQAGAASLKQNSSADTLQKTTKITPKPEPALGSPALFLHELWPVAQDAAARVGQKPEVLLAQAALETGWGSKMIRNDQGGNSFNLFGIKADHRWAGERVTVPTLEYKDGVAVRQKATFRAYDSFADSFRDYADFISGSARYQPALDANDGERYLASLQVSGYATDPQYAKKIVAILARPDTQQIIDQLKVAERKP